MVTNLINLDKERERRVVITVEVQGESLDFEELKNFLDVLTPDDYEMRVDALTLAIHQLSSDVHVYGYKSTLQVAEEFYGFLKDG